MDQFQGAQPQELYDLPDTIAEMIRTFKEPCKETGALFICWEKMGETVRITPAANVATLEMLYVANSSPQLYEARKRALAKHDDVVEGIQIEALKLEEQAQ